MPTSRLKVIHAASHIGEGCVGDQRKEIQAELDKLPESAEIITVQHTVVVGALDTDGDRVTDHYSTVILYREYD